MRCIFKLADAYEERITLWAAASFEAAITAAEAEAVEYALGIGQYLRIAQAYELFQAPAHGVEVFSLLRTSALTEDAYVSAFFDTGTERQTDLSP